ncbi:integral membrane protein, partial [Aspergillus sclerotialis]
MGMSEWSTSRGEGAVAASAVFTSLATILTGIRVYTRACIVKKMGVDDWIILVSVAFSWGFFGLFIGEVDYGMGEHGSKLPPHIITMQMKCFWATVPIYQTSLITAKASILFQYLRVFTTRGMRIACYCLIGFLTTYGTWTIVSAWLNCVPVAKFWDNSIEGYCLSKAGLWFSNSGIHILTDIMIIIYPMPALKKLKLPTRQKIAVMALFSLGGFVLVTTILRLHSLLIISESKDPTHDNVGAATWSAIECNVAIICASLPGTRAFIAKTFPRLFPSYPTYNQYNYNYRSGSKNNFSRSGPANIETSVGTGLHEAEYPLENTRFGHKTLVNGSKVGARGSEGGGV